jgi:transcriptional regulator
MYLPKYFQEDRAEVLAPFLRAHPLGMLVTLDGGRPEVDHVPMLFEPGAGGAALLRGHVARANSVAKRAPDGTEVLVVFRGAQSYVTPNWYASKRVDGKVVPTWNYSVVNVRGRIRWFDAPDRLRPLLDALTAEHEAPRPAPWAVADAPPDYIAGMLGAIVGFEIAVDSMTGKFKASQNRDAADRAGVSRGLATDGVPAADAAELVREPRT